MRHASLRNLLTPKQHQHQPAFNIIEEYAAISPKRKVMLCEHLFIENNAMFQQTVRIMWPEASDKDIKKLSKFLILIKPEEMPIH
jgi:hypothetical protein